MSFETDRDKVAAIEFGLSTAFWTAYLLPMIQDKAKANLEGLATGGSDTDDIKRGWFQALRWVISAPQQEIDIYRKEQEERDAEASITEHDTMRADVGFRSPFGNDPGVLRTTDRPTRSDEEAV